METPLPISKTLELVPRNFARGCAPQLQLQKHHKTTAPAAARGVAPPQWEMPKIRHMGLKGDPFADDDWRLETNMRDMK